MTFPSGHKDFPRFQKSGLPSQNRNLNFQSPMIITNEKSIGPYTVAIVMKINQLDHITLYLVPFFCRIFAVFTVFIMRLLKYVVSNLSMVGRCFEKKIGENPVVRKARDGTYWLRAYPPKNPIFQYGASESPTTSAEGASCDRWMEARVVIGGWMDGVWSFTPFYFSCVQVW